MRVEVAVLGSPSLISLIDSVGVKQRWTNGRASDWKARRGFESPVRQGICLPVESTSSADSLTVSAQPPCAIVCINICAHVKNPKRWQPTNVWMHKNTTRTDSKTGSAATAAPVPYPSMATPDSRKGQWTRPTKKTKVDWLGGGMWCLAYLSMGSFDRCLTVLFRNLQHVQNVLRKPGDLFFINNMQNILPKYVFISNNNVRTFAWQFIRGIFLPFRANLQIGFTSTSLINQFNRLSDWTGWLRWQTGCDNWLTNWLVVTGWLIVPSVDRPEAGLWLLKCSLSASRVLANPISTGLHLKLKKLSQRLSPKQRLPALPHVVSGVRLGR